MLTHLHTHKHAQGSNLTPSSQMDLLCARLAVSVLPERINLLDDDILRNLDEKSVLSLNGA